jgi:hypothetical protein
MWMSALEIMVVDKFAETMMVDMIVHVKQDIDSLPTKKLVLVRIG